MRGQNRFHTIVGRLIHGVVDGSGSAQVYSPSAQVKAAVVHVAD